MNAEQSNIRVDAAINQLKISLDVLGINEPINRAAGNIEQADLEKKSIEEINEAINILLYHNLCQSMESDLESCVPDDEL